MGVHFFISLVEWLPESYGSRINLFSPIFKDNIQKHVGGHLCSVFFFLSG